MAAADQELHPKGDKNICIKRTTRCKGTTAEITGILYNLVFVGPICSLHILLHLHRFTLLKNGLCWLRLVQVEMTNATLVCSHISVHIYPRMTGLRGIDSLFSFKVFQVKRPEWGCQFKTCCKSVQLKSQDPILTWVQVSGPHLYWSGSLFYLFFYFLLMRRLFYLLVI